MSKNVKTKEELVYFLNNSNILFWEDVELHGMTQVHLDAIGEIPDTPDEIDDWAAAHQDY